MVLAQKQTKTHTRTHTHSHKINRTELLLLFSRSVVSDPLWTRGLRHTRLPCPSPSPKLTQTHVHWVSDAIQPSHSLLPTSPPAPNLSQHQGLLQWAGSLHQVAKVLELQHQSFQWIFRVDFLSDSLIWSPWVHGTLNSLLQHHSLKASVLHHSAFFIVQLSHPYMTAGKTIALTIWTLVGKVMSLFFSMLSRFLIAFLPKIKCLLISWLQLLSTVILESEVCYCFHCFPIYLSWSDGTGCHDLSFLNVEL